jgi:F-type H+-transporting ATPase subunit b
MFREVIIAAEAGENINPLIPHVPDLLWGAICFVVLFAFFSWKVLPAVKKLLDERAEVIEGGIKKAEIAKAEAAASLDEYNKQLAEARAEAARIREQARVEGTTILNDLKEQATAEAARVSSSALAQIEAERQGALVSLRSEVGSLAIDLASGVIGESLTNDAKASAIVDRFLTELEASETVGGSNSITADEKAKA